MGQLVEGPPRALPELSFTDEEGTRKSVADFAGKGLVVNFWATWCAPCVEEMPSLDRLQELVEREGILVLPLSSDRGGAPQVRGFYARTRVRNLDIWLDPQGAAGRALGVRGLPTTLVLDRQGREVARLEGSADWSAPEKLEAIRRLLAAPAPERPTST
ncbi:Thiol:disulfide interchange protein tlpA [Roseomonas mucosa]|uniref:TlpA family protein disulfide reductase n=1 Tax=Roseomonas mucosa TaxID=207340 RepID=UPI0021FBAEF1|nr:TlpA disulfide reductase family protein [Roseomonas mucosa]QDJ08777.1 Thiol:disulfide interchange protein tlpA [Roseomonas mucosa]